jgi:predicted metal-dependent phosphoesterase TrpH
LKRSRTLRRVSLRFDLQSHSTSSDGALGAADVVERAASAGVELLALSDHDTIGGVADAVAAGERYGVRISPAVEISAVDDGAGANAVAGANASDGQIASDHVTRELHILGYEIDYEGELLQRRLAEFLADREKRTLRMRDGLREAGFELDEAAIERRIAESKPIGRPHLAEAVLSAPANAQRLADEQIDDIGGLIRGYLIDGKPAFRLRETPTVAEAIEAIHDAGGVAIWAHPFWDIDDDGEVLASIERFRALGIDGVEAFYVTHDERQTRLLFARCEQLGLLSTGSADYHGPDNRLFSRFLAFETYGLQPNLGPIGS